MNYGAVYIHVTTMRATIRGLVALIVVALWNVRCATKLSLMALRHVGPCVGVIPTLLLTDDSILLLKIMSVLISIP